MRWPVELVLFDLGGTLFFEQGPWEELHREADAALWRVLRGAGVTLEPRELYGSAETLFERHAQHQSPDLRETTMAEFLHGLLQQRSVAVDQKTIRAALQSMYSVTHTNWRVEDDAIPALRRLQSDGFRIGAVSNGSDDENTQALADKSGVRPYLEFVISSAAFGRRKPDPSIFRRALDHYRLPPERTVMVGDNYEADVVGAHGVGMQAIWITRRLEPPLPELAQGEPEAIVTALSQIPPLLEES